MEVKTNNPEPIMTVGAPVESFIITPEMIAAAEAKAAGRRRRRAKKLRLNLLIRLLQNVIKESVDIWRLAGKVMERGPQAMVVDSLGETFMVPYRWTFHSIYDWCI